MAGEERTHRPQLPLCWHQPLPGHPPQHPGAHQHQNKPQNSPPKPATNSQNTPMTKPTSSEALPQPTSVPNRPRPSRASPPPCVQQPGREVPPRAQRDAPGSPGSLPAPYLGGQGEFVDSGQSTRTGQHAASGSCWLPRGGSPTSLFLSEKRNHFLTWALGERGAARRPPCPCERQASPPHVDGLPATQRPRDAPGMLGGMREDFGPRHTRAHPRGETRGSIARGEPGLGRTSPCWVPVPASRCAQRDRASCTVRLHPLHPSFFFLPLQSQLV